jgi:hypothetical protein
MVSMVARNCIDHVGKGPQASHEHEGGKIDPLPWADGCAVVQAVHDEPPLHRCGVQDDEREVRDRAAEAVRNGCTQEDERGACHQRKTPVNAGQFAHVLIWRERIWRGAI